MKAYASDYTHGIAYATVQTHFPTMAAAPPDDIEGLTREWLRRIVTHAGTTLTAVAREAGIPQTTLTRFMREDSRRLLPKTLVRLANVSPIELPSALRPIIETRDSLTKEQEVNRSELRPHELPVWGVIPVGNTGEFRLNPIPVATFNRPLHLAAGRRIAVFYAPDDSMAPRWQEGEPVVVDLARPAAPGTVALIRLKSLHDPNDTETHVLRLYNGRGAGVIRVGRYDGVDESSLPIDRVLEVRRVLDWKDLLA